MSNPLFKPVSPLLGWFLLLELLAGLCLCAYWIGLLRHGTRPWEPGPAAGSLLTAWFVASNLLLLRHRRLGVFGLVLCWLVMAWAWLPRF
jgi:hypothetical protein